MNRIDEKELKRKCVRLVINWLEGCEDEQTNSGDFHYLMLDG